MTTTTLRQDEAVPSSYPPLPWQLSPAALALDSDFSWQRLESYVAWRWTARAVVWTVEGCGEPVAVPEEDLHERRPAPPEGEEMTRERVLAERLLHQGGEPVEPLAVMQSSA
jgi:hypothetical protein